MRDEENKQRLVPSHPSSLIPHPYYHSLIWLALAAATALKLYLALTTAGTLDAAGFADHLTKIEQFGGLGVYRVRGAFNNPFNSPPFIIHALRAMGWLTRTTH